MKKLLLSFSLLFASFCFSQANATYQTRANLVTETNITQHVTDLVAIGIRHGDATNLTRNRAARDLIIQKYKDFGYIDNDAQPAIDEISTQTFTANSQSLQNIIVTKKGTTYPNEYVIVCGHFDSVAAGVGANDNGSGVATILELARILKNVPTEYSIKFINFNAEEDGLLGSKAYVTNVVNSTTPKMKIRLVLNIDMIGGIASQNNNTVFCEADNYNGTTTGTKTTNDAASLTFTNQLKTYIDNYSGGLTGMMSNAYSSDYMPFENNSEIITGLYERPTNKTSGAVVDPNPYYHKSTDIITNMSLPYVTKIAKGVVGAVQHFAVASTSTTLAVSDIDKTKDFEFFPNPAKETLNISLDPSITDFSFEISDLNGRKILTTKNQKQINTSQLKPGIYIGTLETEKATVNKKFIIQ